MARPKCKPACKRRNLMLFSSWLRIGKRSARAAQISTPRRAGFRPRFESLEDRSMMSGLPFPTAATTSQLAADISYADNTGGVFTINLQPGTTFALSATTGALPVVGGAKAVDLTILGNGDIIDGSGGVGLFN